MHPVNLEKVRWSFNNQRHARAVIISLNNTWKIVKETPRRRVYSVNAYFVKIYFFKRPFGIIKRRFFDHAKKEWRLSSQIFNTFGNSPEPVAYGTCPGLSIFISRSVEPCITAKELYFNKWSYLSQKKRWLIVDLFANFIIHLYKSGILQTDYNLGNILISTDLSSFFAIDLQRAKHTDKTPTDRQIVKNLSFLLPPVNDIEKKYKLRFFLKLAKAFPGIKPYINDIEDSAFNKIRRQWLHKNPVKLKEKSKRSNFIITPDVRGYIRNDLNARVKELIVKNPERLFRYAIKDFKNAKRSRVSLIDCRGTKYVLKKYNVKSLLFRLRRLIFPSLAWKVWKRTGLFSQRGIPTPILFASIDLGKGLSYKGTFTVYEYIDAKNDAGLFKSHILNKTERDLLLHKLADLLFQMHKRGIYHGDAKISNFLWVEKKRKTRFIVIDLDGVHFMQKVNKKQRLSDLKNMAASLVWWDRDPQIVDDFFDAYLKTGHLLCKNHDSWLQKLQKKVEHQIAHRQKRQKKQVPMNL